MKLLVLITCLAALAAAQRGPADKCKLDGNNNKAFCTACAKATGCSQCAVSTKTFPKMRVLNNKNGALAYNRCSQCDQTELNCKDMKSCAPGTSGALDGCTACKAGFFVDKATPVAVKYIGTDGNPTTKDYYGCKYVAAAGVAQPSAAAMAICLVVNSNIWGRCQPFVCRSRYSRQLFSHHGPYSPPGSLIGCRSCVATFGCDSKKPACSAGGCVACPATRPVKNPRTKKCGTCKEVGGASCLACDGTGCTKCKTGFYVAAKTCKQCGISGCANCATTEGKLTCTECKLGYNFVTNTTDGTQKCLLCRETGGEKCTACLTDFTGLCKTCAAGWTVDSTTGKCVSCSTGCLACDSADLTKCTKCGKGLYVDAATSTCAQCKLTWGDACQACDASTCTTCAKTFTVVDGKCVKAPRRI